MPRQRGATCTSQATRPPPPHMRLDVASRDGAAHFRGVVGSRQRSRSRSRSAATAPQVLPTLAENDIFCETCSEEQPAAKAAPPPRSAEDCVGQIWADPVSSRRSATSLKHHSWGGRRRRRRRARPTFSPSHRSPDRRSEFAPNLLNTCSRTNSGVIYS